MGAGTAPSTRDLLRERSRTSRTQPAAATATGTSEARTGIALNHRLLVSEVAVTLQEQIDAAVEACLANTTDRKSVV